MPGPSKPLRLRPQFTAPPGLPWCARMRKPPARIELITHDFPLRPDLLIRMTLPVELTTEDAARLRDFVRALAMDGAL